MSKTLSKSRTAFAGFVVVLQLFLLPATHVLHLGCQHSDDDASIATVSVFDALENAWERCWSSHCCDHCAKPAAVADDQPTDSSPIHPPHDEDSCPVCHAAFAARIATTAAVDLSTAQPVCEFPAVDSHAVYSTSRYCVLSRGPPTAPLG